MKKVKKINLFLEDLQIQSFVTNLENEQKQKHFTGKPTKTVIADNRTLTPECNATEGEHGTHCNCTQPPVCSTESLCPHGGDTYCGCYSTNQGCGRSELICLPSIGLCTFWECIW